MFLKKLLLHGFKSFADRTEFEFGAGMTGVVGPNGCGKSNILDALRWVLGEQSARSLRGAKMLDVIFNGSRSRKAMNFAEVELIFDNASGLLACDEREVSVARTLYRSGESEYRLNGNPTRLKDIRNLLLDTGVGVDAYSIIEQGRVDVMLQANPAQRREIFEEAAGVSRYKVQRIEAQRKLERTQNNLLRLNDLLDELERQLRSVKIAAGRARRFQEYDQRLRELRSSFSLARYHELRLDTQERQRGIDALQGVLAALRAELAAHDASGGELDRRRLDLDDHIRAAEGQLAQLLSESSALEERISQNTRRIYELTETQAAQCRQEAEAAARIDQVAARIESEQARLAELERESEQFAARVGGLRDARGDAQRRFADVRQAMDAARSAAFESARSASLIQNERQNIEVQQQRGRAQLARIDERRRENAAERAAHDSACEQARTRLAVLNERAAECSRTLQSHDASAAALETEIEQSAHEIGRHKERRSGVMSRLNVLDELEARHEGLAAGPRWVLEWSAPDSSPRPGGVIGLVADLLHIDAQHVATLQNVLDRFEHHLVVRESHAFFAELARRGDPPAAIDLIALDRMPGRPMNRYADAPGFVACAADLARCDAAYAHLSEALLGRVILVDSFERALALAGDAPDGYLFVSPDGAAVETGGRITIGRGADAGGLISRKAHIRQLRTELDEVETALERAVRRRSALDQRRSDLRIQRDALLSRIAIAQREHAEAHTALARLEEAAARFDREVTILDSEQSALERTQSELAQRLAALDSECEQCEAAVASSQSQVDALAVELHELEVAVARLAQQLTDAEVEAGRTAERCAAQQQAIDELARQREAQARLREQAAQAARDAAARIDASRAELAASQRRLDELRSQCAERESAAAGLRSQRQVLLRRHEACNGAVRRLHEQIDQAERALSSHELALRESQVHRENLVTRVREELSIDLEALYEGYVHAQQDWDAIRTEIDELREKIARLGHVNLDAIAELEQLTPRYENLVAQRNDLLSSIQRLEALIQELDTESQSRFERAFTEIRENFIDLFRKLFGGGKADIILEDPSRPLESGIEIIARPPGKEPQSISLLSGGEKTMTAVALLFAVFRSKPSPFAILDEVDAALDEANIDRFNRMLMEFLSESQFVVITHNKRTMQGADVLYGITMQEPGVSKRVSVRFEDRVEAPTVA